MENKKIQEQFEEGVRWQNKHNLKAQYDTFERFVAGEQWPAATERTKNLPRPVFNLTEMVISRKRASITNQPFLMTFRASSIDDLGASKAAGLYTAFAKDVLDDMDFTNLENDFIDDAATFGTGVIHFYWDSAAGDSGGLMGETIHPLDVVVADMHSDDIQRQDYIIIKTIRSTSDVKELARSNGISELVVNEITGDEDDGRTSVYTKYYKEDGAVYFDIEADEKIIVERGSLTPKDEDATEDDYNIGRYPVVCFRWKKKRKSFYGIGEAAGLIEVNKAFNFIKAMQILTSQATGWPQKVIREGGISNEALTNEPGAIIKEVIPDSIRYLAPPPSTYMASSIATEMWEMQRTITGVTEVTAGEMVGSQMAASAIIALQTQAKTPIREIQRRYFSAVKEIGRIFEDFFKTYYSLPVVVEKEDGLGDMAGHKFTATDYADMNFKLSIDVGTGSDYSEALTMSTLDKFYDRKEITIEQYCELAPSTVVPFKERLKAMLQQNKAIQPAMAEDIKPDTEARSVDVLA